MTAAVLRINGKDYAFGARWLVAETGKKPTAEAAQFAAHYAAQWVAYSGSQFGLFAFGEDGDQPKANPLFPWKSAGAALARSVLQAAWLGAWPLPDGRYWTAVVVNGHIDPEGDRIHPDEEAARDFLRSKWASAEETAWRALFAPAEWGFPNSRPDTLPELLKKAKPVTVRRLARPAADRNTETPRAPVFTSRRIALAILAAGAGVLLYERLTPPRPAPAPPTAAAPTPAPAPEAPPPRYVPAANTLTACLVEIDKRWPDAALIPGWRPTGLVCNPHVLTVTAAAVTTTPYYLSLAGAPQGITANPTARQATAAIALAPAAEIEQLPTIAENALRDYLARYAETIGATWQASRQATAPALPGEQRPAPRFAPIAWSLTTTAPPALWAPVIARFPETALVALRLDLSKPKPWTIEAITYVQP